MWVRPEAAPVAAPAKKFQFTHPCGCDNNALKIAVEHSGFNSRTRVGATRPCRRKFPLQVVSIHAPVWVRPWKDVIISLDDKFQFTHPCGCDRRGNLIPSPGCSFNSRTRVGATVTNRKLSQLAIVSIHAPVWVRRRIAHGRLSYGGFQFTHPCGCDICLRYLPHRGNSFNSRTRVGATC